MKDIVAGILRHFLTLAAGGLVTSGLLNASKLEVISGFLLALLGMVWSVIVKKVVEKNPSLQGILDLVNSALAATPAPPATPVVPVVPPVDKEVGK